MSTVSKAEAATKTLYSVQALRGIAAMGVVLCHSKNYCDDWHFGSTFNFVGGSSGVDLFFAISGCVMVLSTKKLWGKSSSWRIFLLRRFIRVAPLYWIFTVLKAGSVALFPGLIRHSILTWQLVICSLLFIPVWNPGQHEVTPLLIVGWTLSYEMFFYVLFGLSLGFGKSPFIFLIPILLAFATAGLFRASNWPHAASVIDPILVEFVFGILIALVFQSKWLLPRTPALILVSALFLYLLLFPYFHFNDQRNFRPLLHGIPCALLLYAAISLELSACRWMAGLPLLLGDASYSIYLCHGFVLPPLSDAWQKLHWHGTACAYTFLIAALVVSSVAGVAVHWFIENPLLRFFNRQAHRTDPVGTQVRV